MIDDLQVTFDDGLTIITGETGAGKSILLGGLSLILGKRADLSSIKDASRKCIIEATFNIANYNLVSFFEDEDLDYEIETIIRREILPSGKSRAFVNDSPVNLSVLANLGEHLIDIHSQHQTLELANNDFQFQIIDALANNSVNLQEYKKELKVYNSLIRTIAKLKEEKAEAIKEYDYNLFLLNELVEANLVSGELSELEDEYTALNNVEEIKGELQLSYQLLNDEQVGVLQAMTSLKNSLQKLSDLSNNYSELSNRLNSVFIELDDVFSEVEAAQDDIEANPARLEEVNAKLQKLHNLLLKHSFETVEELIELRDVLSQKVLATESIDSSISEKEIELQKAIVLLEKQALNIHNSRKKAIPVLVNQLKDILEKLGMPNANFEISVDLSDKFYVNGKDDLSFLFTANKGGEFKELKKAASGGELSRIMLAVKSILAKYIQLPTIMFDEIDTGVSGEISHKMGGIMQEMSRTMQVFTITHLPQIAAKGDAHYKVYKTDNANETVTHLMKLNTEERIVEIAQMLGGKETTTSAIAHAKQLLN